MTNQLANLDRVFHALSNSTRREVLEQLEGGPAALTDLAQQHDMALPSFFQHLQVLEAAGLVTSEKNGRVRTFRLEPQNLIEAEHWMTTTRRQWEARLNQLDELLLEMKENDK